MSTSKRQSPIGILYNLYSSIKDTIIPLAFLIYKWIASETANRPDWLYILTTIFILGIIIYALLTWWNETYTLEEEEIIVKTGLLRRTVRQIPYYRINNISTIAEWKHRLLGVTRLDIETSSSVQGSEASLLIGKKQLLLVKEQLSVKSSAQDETRKPVEVKKVEVNDAEVHTEVQTYKFSVKELAILSLSGSNVLIGIPILSFFISMVSKITGEDKESKSGESLQKIQSIDWSELFLPLLLGAVIFLGVSWMISIIIQMFKYGYYLVVMDEHTLRITNGLLDKKETVIKLDKIQSIRIKENLINRLLGYCTIHIDSVGLSNKNKGIIFPIVSNKVKDKLVQSFFPQYLYTKPIEGVPSKAKLGFILRYLMTPSLAALILLFLVPPAGLFVWALAILFLMYLNSVYRLRGYAYGEELFVIRNALFTVTTVITTRKSITSVSFQQSPFQLRGKLSSLMINIDAPIRKKEYRLIGMPSGERNEVISWYKNKGLVDLEGEKVKQL